MRVVCRVLQKLHHYCILDYPVLVNLNYIALEFYKQRFNRWITYNPTLSWSNPQKLWNIKRPTLVVRKFSTIHNIHLILLYSEKCLQFSLMQHIGGLKGFDCLQWPTFHAEVSNRMRFFILNWIRLKNSYKRAVGNVFLIQTTYFTSVMNLISHISVRIFQCHCFVLISCIWRFVLHHCWSELS